MQYFSRLMLFKTELNNSNPLASKNNEIAIYFAKFLDQMWNSPRKQMGNVFSPAMLKLAIGRANSMFKGFSQHDSDELIQFLCDQLHEDLNRVQLKPYISMPGFLDCI